MGARLALGVSLGWIALAFLTDGLTVLVLPLRLGDADEATNLGLVTFVGLGAAVAAQPLAGLVADRLRPRIDRRLFIAAASVVVLAALAWLAAAPGFVAVAAAFVAVQVAGSALQAGQQTLIPEYVGATARGRASGLKAAFDVGGAFVAFLVLGVLVAGSGDGAAVGAIALVVVAATLGAAVLLPRRGRGAHDDAPARNAVGRLPAGFGRLVAARFLFLLGTYGVGRFLLLLVAERLGIAPADAADEAGGLLAGLTLATAAAALGSGWLADRFGRDRLMAIGALVSAAGIVVLVPAAGFGGLVAGGLVMSAGTGMFVAANWAATTDLVPAPESGRLMGIANVGTGAAAALAGLLGPLVDGAGFGPVLALCAVAAAAALLPLARPRPAPAAPLEARA